MLRFRNRYESNSTPAKAKTPQEPEWSFGLPTYVALPREQLTDEDRLQRFTTMIRGPKDPICTAERKRNNNEPLAALGALSWKEISKVSVVDWKKAIWRVIGDGEPRTFNQICIEVCDRTADICSGHTIEWALWDFVLAKVVEHTSWAPILFRKSDERSEDGPIQNMDDPRILLTGINTETPRDWTAE